MKQKHVVVCGGGIVGLFCAYYLRSAGHDVTVIERNGSSIESCVTGSAGYISPSHVIPLAAPGVIGMGLKWMLQPKSPFYIKPRLDLGLMRWGWHFFRSCSADKVRRGAPVLADLCVRSRGLYLEFDRATQRQIELRQHGLLNLCKSQRTLDHEANVLAKLANELGVEARVLDARQTAAVESGTEFDVVGSIYFPHDAHLTPHLLVRALVDEVSRQKVNLLYQTSITGWQSKSGRIKSIVTSRGVIEGDEFVLACGAWSPSVVNDLKIRLPMEAGKGYSLTLEKAPFEIRTSIICTEKRVAVTPMGSRLRFGGTMEISGLRSPIRPERIQQIIDSAISYFPRLQRNAFHGVSPWYGLRPVSPDGLPYVGRFKEYRNLVAACGHAMLGLTLAPVTGQIVSEIVADRRSSPHLEALSPDRF